MAITRTKKGSLVDTKIEDKSLDDKKPIIEEKKVETSLENKIKPKKKGFIGTTIDELKKSEWPSFNYVLRWSAVIVLFTAVFSVILGGFDSSFNNGVKFIDCTSPKGRNQDVRGCGTEFLEQLIGRR